jgi:hypothetical protein
MSWLPNWFGGGNQEPEPVEQVTMFLDLTCEVTGKPFTIGGFSLPAAHDPSGTPCMCVSCWSSALEGLNGLAEIEEEKKRR